MRSYSTCAVRVLEEFIRSSVRYNPLNPCDGPANRDKDSCCNEGEKENYPAMCGIGWRRQLALRGRNLGVKALTLAMPIASTCDSQRRGVA